jgi:O-antigen chain-terminating methyltransferase
LEGVLSDVGDVMDAVAEAAARSIADRDPAAPAAARRRDLAIEAKLMAKKVGRRLPTPVKVKIRTGITTYRNLRSGRTAALIAITDTRHEVATIQQQIAGHAGGLTQLDLRLADAAEELSEAGTELHTLAGDVGGLAGEQARLTEQLQAARDELEGLRGELAPLRSELARLRSELDVHTATTIGAASSLESAAYEAFEARFRGGFGELRDRMAAYVDDVYPAVTGTGKPLLDVGPGRGEWLHLLRERGVAARGVDTNPAFVDAGRADGLDVELREGVEYLTSLPPASLGAVTAFHVAEHLPLPVLERLLSAASRAIAPGGVVIIETPNPNNVRVGASMFWLDPGHLRPLPPELLAFLVAHHGFEAIETRFLHPMPEYDAARSSDDALQKDLAWALYGPQDYAVLGRVAAPH